VTLTTGTIFVMWLGEQITERGIGNGISLLIFAGIIIGLPNGLTQVVEKLRSGDTMAVIGVIALAVFAPWAIRNYSEFGTPLPAQAATNALSISGLDIFAWNDPPTLSRYLEVGPARLVEMRVLGIGHNVVNVLLLLGIPLSLLGLLAVPFTARSRTLRRLLLFGLVTFAFTSLVFPVATTWGTFLHAAGPVHVLLVIGALLLLDAGIARLGGARGWTRPVAWLGPALTIFGSLLFSVVLLGAFGRGSVESRDYYAALTQRMADAGHALDASAGPVISDYPIWIADTQQTTALALPDETPSDVLHLASTFAGTRLIVLTGGDDHAHWPEDLDAGAENSDCFREVEIGVQPDETIEQDVLAGTRVWEIVCL
jgi:hypothetical protein